MALRVRRAHPDELDACADIYQRVLRDTFTWQAPEKHRREDFIEIEAGEDADVAWIRLVRRRV